MPKPILTWEKLRTEFGDEEIVLNMRVSITDMGVFYAQASRFDRTLIDRANAKGSLASTKLLALEAFAHWKESK